MLIINSTPRKIDSDQSGWMVRGMYFLEKSFEDPNAGPSESRFYQKIMVESRNQLGKSGQKGSEFGLIRIWSR